MTQQMHEVKDRLVSDFKKNLEDIYSRYKIAQEDAWKKFKETTLLANEELLKRIKEVHEQYLCKIAESIDTKESDSLLIEFEEQSDLVNKEYETVSKQASDELKTALKNASNARDRDRDIAQQEIQTRLNTFFD